MFVADVTQIITDEANRDGIPAWIPLTIALKESSMDPKNVGDKGTSFGLFQLHQGGLAPAGMSSDQLFDPATNARIAIPHMLDAYKAGVQQGLSGYDLVAYTANNSAWPGNIGVNSPQAIEYDAGLKEAYSKITGGGTGITTLPSAGASVSLGKFTLLDGVLLGVAAIILLAAFF